MVDGNSVNVAGRGCEVDRLRESSKNNIFSFNKTCFHKNGGNDNCYAYIGYWYISFLMINACSVVSMRSLG